MTGEKRLGSMMAAMAIVLAICTGCHAPVSMKVRPLGALEQEDYAQLEAAANLSQAKVSNSIGSTCEPTLVYYVHKDYDFTGVKSVYIPDFKSSDPRAGEDVTRGAADEVKTVLLQKELFTRVDRTDGPGADIALLGSIAKYQEITGKQLAKTVVAAGLKCGLCEMEVRIIDTKSGKTIGAIKINHVTTRTGPFRGGLLGWSGSMSPAKELPYFIAAVFENIRAGRTSWTNGIWYTCIRDDGVSLIDRMCAE